MGGPVDYQGHCTVALVIEGLPKRSILHTFFSIRKDQEEVSDTANRVPYRFRHRRRSFSADVRCPCSSSRVAGLPPPLLPPPRQRDCAPPCARTRTKRCGLFGTLIFPGGCGGKNTCENLETHAKKRVPNRTRGGRCGSQSEGAVPAFRPPSRPFNVGQFGNLWHCTFMGWGSTALKNVFGSVPFWPAPTLCPQGDTTSLLARARSHSPKLHGS